MKYLDLCDTHAHLYFEQFDTDREETLKKARELGINYIFLPNVDSETIQPLYNLTDAFPDLCFPMMGLHPCSVKANYEQELDIIEQQLRQKPNYFYAIGEIGLDFYWDITYKDQQYDALERQINWAKDYRLPIVLHCRESHSEVFKVVKKMSSSDLHGVFHCFSGSKEQAIELIQLGNFYLGIGGVVTYKNSRLQDIVRAIDLSHIVLETDAPFLAPEPYRSAKEKSMRRNESAYIAHIAQYVADLKGVPVETVAEITTQNALNLFKWHEKQKNKAF